MAKERNPFSAQRSTAIDMQRAQSALLKLGASSVGAKQLLSGQMVTDPADRQLIAGLLSQLITELGIPALDGSSKEPGSLDVTWPATSRILFHPRA
jgi:hypothetical protein